jgi:hypothetical protein
MAIINYDLIRNPANWIIVWSMIAFGLIALSLVNDVSREL